jgi:hypothetical protein
LLNESGHGFQATHERTGQSLLEIPKSSSGGAADIKETLNAKHLQDRVDVGLGEWIRCALMSMHGVVLRGGIGVIATLNFGVGSD